MGALHEGHFRLVDCAKRENHSVVVSIFVNPMQFGPKEDFLRYPRTFKKDVAGLKRRGTDLVFAPEVRELLASPLKPKRPFVPAVAKGLCGPFRPGHFAGVSAIVELFFRLAQPDNAYFGLKDFQQCRVVEEMAARRCPDVRIRTVPTARQKDGLAISSRNRYLSRAERKRAAGLYLALKKAVAGLRRKEKPAELEKQMRACVASISGASIDYLSIVDAGSLKKVKVSSSSKPAKGFLVAGAIRIGSTRLIDNVQLK